MLKINLAPTHELDSPFWFVPDLLLFLALSLIGFAAIQMYVGSIETEIDMVRQKAEKMKKGTEELQPKLKSYDEMIDKVDRLSNKRDSLKDITKVKIQRYKPVIVMEHLQNLKPYGVWFDSLQIKDEGAAVAIQGGALSNSLLAEFITKVEKTRNNEVDENDLRTQIFFKGTRLKFSKYQERTKGFEEINSSVNFEMDAWVDDTETRRRDREKNKAKKEADKKAKQAKQAAAKKT